MVGTLYPTHDNDARSPGTRCLPLSAQMCSSPGAGAASPGADVRQGSFSADETVPAQMWAARSKIVARDNEVAGQSGKRLQAADDCRYKRRLLEDRKEVVLSRAVPVHEQSHFSFAAERELHDFFVHAA